ncbi:hypothetical protein TraAM80_06128 [Trypanosoma rangeli]|uniref:Uncharacterized protein n=1 Tax=Trypanosoma rangeli TaxID=5698 RepID=A0A3R7KAT6_TRYRA|nr:uncharacterized protein TraAM80_06128 [Trypanosoma rangeli]RNF02835.1 hypothetical protein TraAM80_06128 [Trypanosoma rangeli]|eukprot:RNF02835.1 hypothetical protein TraAM80_06128 [Trypanosoma rangeli]
MSTEEAGSGKINCHLILLCSDSPLFDFNVLTAILAHGVALAPTPSEAASATPPSADATGDNDAEGSLINAILAALQAASRGPSEVGTNAFSATALSTATSGKVSKALKGAKKSAAMSVTATSAPIRNGSLVEGLKTLGGDGTQRSRAEWYSVVKGPQWRVPVVFIHQLPELERCEGAEGTGSMHTGTREAPADFSAMVQNAFRMIAEDMDGFANTNNDTCIRTLLSDGSVLGEQTQLVPQPGGKPRVFTGEIAVVLALQDPRDLPALLNRRASPTNAIDTRLVVQFVDGRPAGVARATGSVNTSGRSRAAASGKRTAPRESAMPGLSTGAKDADGSNASGDAVNTLNAWIERRQREGGIKVVTSAGEASGPGVVCLREVFESGGDDKGVWVQRCVRNVLPMIQHVSHDIARYVELIGSKTVYRLPATLAMPQPQAQAPTQQEEPFVGTETTVESSMLFRTRDQAPTMFTPLASGMTMTATSARTMGFDETVLQYPPTSDLTLLPGNTARFLHGEREKWPYYVREVKVRGQWTCASAACALAAQVTVSLARQQELRVVCPADEGDTNTSLAVMNEQDAALPVVNIRDRTGASLLLQLRQYASKRTVLGALDMNGGADIAAAAAGVVAAAAAAAAAAGRRDGKSSIPVETPGSTPPRCSPIPVDEDQSLLVNTTATLPMDHTLDRPANPPSPEEIRWMTQQFIKRGIGSLASLPAEVLRGEGPLMFSPDELRAAIKVQELLEETLNGHTLNDAEDAMDERLLHLVEEDFKRASETLAYGWNQVWDDLTVAVGLTTVNEKLRSSVERKLTALERTHILQQIYLMQLARKSRMTGMVVATSTALASTRNGWAALTHSNARRDVVGPTLRSVEECMTMPVAIRRLYEFQSRFGSHICRVMRCPISDPLETLDGNLTTLYSTHAENVYSRKRVQAVMLGGVPVPHERQTRWVWCHYVAGVPTIDQMNELSASRGPATSHAVPPSAASVGEPAVNATSTVFGASIGELLRQQLLQRLQASPQLLLAPVEDKGRTNGVCRSEGKLQTVLEGRHVLYPFENSVVEVVTTDRGRMCRYVKPSELTCTLHYGIAPPPPPSPSLSAAAGSVAGGNVNALVPPHVPHKLPRDEAIYFTATFDDGVVFTCTPHWATPVNPSTVVEKEPDVSPSTVSVKSPSLRRGKAANRSSRRGTNTSTVLTDDNHPSARRGVGAAKQKRRGGEDVDPLTAVSERSIRVEEHPRVFPVALEGSVLLWTAAPEVVPGEDTNANTSLPVAVGAEVPRKIPSLAATVAANGVTVHCEEEDGILWIMRHESSERLATELLRCVHVYDAHARWEETVEMEVHRAVLEEVGAVCRYFHSGATRMMYPNGTVVTRYPVPVATLGGTPVICETVLMATGLCYVRQLCEGSASPFVHVVANTLETRVAYDRSNRCRIVSRADGVMIVYYYLNRDSQEPNKQQQGEGGEGRHLSGDSVTNQQYRKEDEEWEERPAWSDDNSALCDTDVIARVTLHADGTCITTFSSCLIHEACTDPPAPLKTLLEQVGVVGAACGATVHYCVEAPSLPRVFVCASLHDGAWATAEGARCVTLQDTEAQRALTAALQNIPSPKCNSTPEFAASPLSLTGCPFPALNAGTSDNLVGTFIRCKSYNWFYIVFGDGSVLRRRVMYRGMRGNGFPFLETLFTRSTATSIRVIHESGLAIVEPSEAVRRNAEAITSLAIGEGFAMFDMALGGMRLVDHQHHVTEVHNLYSSGPVRAGLTSATLEGLLRKLVLPTYTPHTVTKARQVAMRQEELRADARTRWNRATGTCAALTTRLRELAEGFVIAHNLLRIDILNMSKRQWEAGSLGNVEKKSAREFAPEASWGNTTSSMATEGSTVLETLVPATVAIPLGVLPILFSELENGVVVQHIHHHEVEEYVHARGAELFPVFLTRSTAAGEPGVQQLTFFRAEANVRAADVSAPVGPTSTVFASGRCSSCLWHTTGDLKFGQSNTVVTGSLLSGAVQRQKRLALFSGRRLAFPTTQWLPPAVQPPRHFLNSRLNTQGSGARAGGVVLMDDVIGKSGGATDSLSSYERLRIFFKFNEFTPTAQQAVLASEVRRHEQLASMLTYHKAMNALTPEMSYNASDEQRRLREKYLITSTSCGNPTQAGSAETQRVTGSE